MKIYDALFKSHFAIKYLTLTCNTKKCTAYYLALSFMGHIIFVNNTFLSIFVVECFTI